FPYHLEEERLNEGEGEGSIGTTGRGIGPCYMDKMGRSHGIRLGELLHPEHLRSRLNTIVQRKNRLLRALNPDARQFDAGVLADEYEQHGAQMRPFLQDSVRFLHKALDQNKRLLFEAAQGSLLDV